MKTGALEFPERKWTTGPTLKHGLKGASLIPNDSFIHRHSTDADYHSNAASGPKYYYDFRRRSLQRWKEIAEEVPDLPIHWGGSVQWDLTPEELKEYLAEHSSWGYDVVNVTQTEIKELEPALHDSLLPDWGLSTAEEGQLEADLAARLLIDNAEARGGATLLNEKVTSFIKQDGQIAGVVTTSGEIRADHVVLAAGLGSVELLALLNISLPVTGVAGLLVNSQPTSDIVVNGVVNAKELHLRQTLDGVIRSGADYTGGDPSNDPQAEADELFGRLQDAIVGGKELVFDHYTIGYRPTPDDGFPILGPTGLKGLTIAVMHSGVTNAAIVGDLLSKQILSGESDPALVNFRFDRFNSTSVFQRVRKARYQNLV